MYWYHEETKHSYYSVRSNPNQLDWANQPSTYKVYPNTFQKSAVDQSNPWHAVVHYAAAISAKKFYPPNTEYYLRINPSAGALYPNELYFQARDAEGFKNGIYHYEVKTNQAVLLHTLEENEGLEPYMGYKHAMKGLLFLVSAIYYRSSWKYKNRAFRYCLLDAGHLLGSIEHSALLMPHATSILYDIEREKLNTLFGFEQKEFFLAGASVAVPLKDQEVTAVNFSLPYVEGAGSFEQNEMIEIAYRQTSHLVQPKTQRKNPKLIYQEKRLKESLLTRRSQRGFEDQAITKAQFNFIMEMLNAPILSDCDEKIEIYAVLNRVHDMPVGLYHDTKILNNQELSQKAGYLCLEQYSLGTAGAVTFFLVSTAQNYQALYQKAGIIGQRLYIVSNYLNIGCSGIGAYYDDEVNAFVEQDGMILYALAIGK